PSKSPMASPVFFVKKKDLCISVHAKRQGKETRFHALIVAFRILGEPGMGAKAGCVRGVDENSPIPDQEQMPQHLTQQHGRKEAIV
ncbi:hypothetical protein K439DRAFT_1374223, partial [Ramaria rubella]